MTADERFHQAEYVRSPIPSYEGNPLIEALPPIWSEEQVFSLLETPINIDNGLRDQPGHIRKQIVLATLQNCFSPLPQHLTLESSLSATIRLGYVTRNPLKQNNTPNNKARRNGLLNGFHPSQQIQNLPLGFAFRAPSGMGKSASLRRILHYYPQVVRHKNYHGEACILDQITYLHLEMTPRGSMKGMLQQILLTIDQILNTDYAQLGHWRRASVDELVPFVCSVVQNHAIGVLLVDEIQNLTICNFQGREQVLNFFTELTNVIGIPVVLIGTPRATQILTSELRTARRFLGMGDIQWQRMTNNEIWDTFLKALWPYQFTRKETPLSDEIRDAIFEETQGIIDLGVKLYSLAQMYAIDTDETISPATIRRVAEKSFSPVAPFLERIRQGNHPQHEDEDFGRIQFAPSTSQLPAEPAQQPSPSTENRKTKPRQRQADNLPILQAGEQSRRTKTPISHLLKENGLLAPDFEFNQQQCSDISRNHTMMN